LQILGLSHNRLTTFPIDFPLSYRLQKLYAGSNDITEIPKDVVKLKNLVKLDLSDNYLTTLPETLIKLPSLTELNLTDNMILQWPTNFVKLQNKVNVSVCRVNRPVFTFFLYLTLSPQLLQLPYVAVVFFTRELRPYATHAKYETCVTHTTYARSGQ